MKAGHKFLLGAGIIVASVVFLIAQGRQGDRRLFPDARPSSLPRPRPILPSTMSASRWAPRSCPAPIRRDDAAPPDRLRGERRRKQFLSGHLPRARARHLHRRQRHRSDRGGPPRPGRRLPGHRGAGQVRLALRGRGSTRRRRPSHDPAGRVLRSGWRLLRPVWAAGRWASPGAGRTAPTCATSVRGASYATFGALLVAALALWKGLVEPRLQHRVRGRLHLAEPARRLHLLGLLGGAEGLAALLGGGALALRRAGAAAHAAAATTR